MTVSDYIFEYLYKKGCSEVFMVSGSSAMWLTDALQRNKDIKAVCCHHEQATAMAADGYGRVNNVPGACLVTIGPGATNAITGVAQAYLDSSPMFVISGQANSRLLQYEMDTQIRQQGCQSINLEPIITPITKYFKAIMNPDDIIDVMDEAYCAAMKGRKGPVWIDVPVDIQNRQISNDSVKKDIVVSEKQKKFIENEKLQQIAEMICGAKKPLILAGYGVRSANAMQEMQRLSQDMQIPIVTSRGGIDVIESDNPLYIGRPGSYGDRASHFAIQQADLLLVLGSRLSISTIGYYPDRFGKNAKKIMIDIDAKELAKEDVPVDIKMQCDLKSFLERLNKQLNQQSVHTSSEWIKFCQGLKKKYPTVLSEYAKEKPLNEYYFTDLLSEIAKPSSNIVVDTGSVCNIVSQSWKIKVGQRYLISGGLSCMGFWATALGAYQSEKDIIAIAGDGSTQMNIQEFATLQYNKIPVKLFIYNNNGYMLIRHNQHNYMDDRFLGVGADSGVQTPDFCKVAQAYGLKSVRITADDDVEAKIQDVLHTQGPVICEVMCQEFAPIVPRIASRVMPDGSLKAAEFDDLFPFLDA